MTKEPKSKGKMFKTHNDLSPKTRSAMVELLNQQLADASDLYSQTKQAHWNVKGKHFHALHLLFDELAEHLEEQIDTIAERATALGGYASGTARMAAANSRLPEYPTGAVEGEDHLIALIDRWGKYAQSSREAIDSVEKMEDMGTSDMFTDISRAVDKDLWFLEAHIQG